MSDQSVAERFLVRYLRTQKDKIVIFQTFVVEDNYVKQENAKQSLKMKLPIESLFNIAKIVSLDSQAVRQSYEY